MSADFGALTDVIQRISNKDIKDRMVKLVAQAQSISEGIDKILSLTDEELLKLLFVSKNNGGKTK